MSNGPSVSSVAVAIAALGALREAPHMGTTRYVVHRPLNPPRMDPGATAMRKRPAGESDLERLEGTRQRRERRAAKRAAVALRQGGAV